MDISHLSGKTPVARDWLNNCNKGDGIIHLHCITNVLDICSGHVLLVTYIMFITELIVNYWLLYTGPFRGEKHLAISKKMANISKC